MLVAQPAVIASPPMMVMQPPMMVQQQMAAPAPEPAYSFWPPVPAEKLKIVACCMVCNPIVLCLGGCLGLHKYYLSGSCIPCTCFDCFGAVCAETDHINLMLRSNYYRGLKIQNPAEWKSLACVHSPASVVGMS
eukprot:ANDGO_07416.mRNA.1 hypothetical protein